MTETEKGRNLHPAVSLSAAELGPVGPPPPPPPRLRKLAQVSRGRACVRRLLSRPTKRKDDCIRVSFVPDCFRSVPLSSVSEADKEEECAHASLTSRGYSPPFTEDDYSRASFAHCPRPLPLSDQPPR